MLPSTSRAIRASLVVRIIPILENDFGRRQNYRSGLALLRIVVGEGITFAGAVIL